MPDISKAFPDEVNPSKSGAEGRSIGYSWFTNTEPVELKKELNKFLGKEWREKEYDEVTAKRFKRSYEKVGVIYMQTYISSDYPKTEIVFSISKASEYNHFKHKYILSIAAYRKKQNQPEGATP